MPARKRKGKPNEVPRSTSMRLSLYLRELDGFHAAGRNTISSGDLGDVLGLTDAQVRKDLGRFGQFGFPGIGYKVEELIIRIRRILGMDRIRKIALVGIGHLGTALANFGGFHKRGFEIAALFDNDRGRVGRKVGGIEIMPMERFEEVIRREGIELCILAVPADAAQPVARTVCAAGIQGILNFAPIALNTPAQVSVSTVDLTVQLEQLVFQMVGR